MSEGTANYEKQIKFYVTAQEAEELKQIAKNAKFKSVGDYVRHCVQTDAKARGEKFEFQPRGWNGYRDSKDGKSEDVT